MSRSNARLRPAGYWTSERIRAEARLYKYKSDFKKNAPGALRAAVKLGIYDNAVSHMSAKPAKRLWTRDKVLKEARKCRYIAEFRRKAPGAYDAALRMKIMPLLNHFIRPAAKSKWTQRRIQKEAKKYRSRTEFFMKAKGAYRAAQKVGILAKVCSHMAEIRKPAGYWTEERILLEAQKYKTRTSFIKDAPGAYNCAVRLGILERAYSHMPRVGSKYKRAIYAFEFPDRTVYVGLTFNFDRRFREHMSHNRLIKSKSKAEGHKFVKFDGWYDKDTAAVKELEKVDEYRKKGWTILNKVKPGGLGKDKFWTVEMVEREASKFPSIYDFRTKSPRAYSAASRLGIIGKITKHLTSRMKPSGYWNRITIAGEAKKFSSRSAFQKGSPSAYQTARRLGILHKVCAHMVRTRTPIGYWNEKQILRISRKYKSLTEFLKKEGKVAKAARRLGLYQKVTAQLRPTRLPPGFWTKEKIQEEAQKYKHRVDFWKNSPSAYRAATELGIRNEVCRHMRPKQIQQGSGVEVNGTKFPSVAKAASAFGLDGRLVGHRLRVGWKPDEALGLVTRMRPTPGIEISFRGKRYRSRSALARAYGFDVKIVEQRLRLNWSLEEALGLESRPDYKGPKEITVNGNWYRSLPQAAKAFGKETATVAFRLKSGWSVEQAFDIEPPPGWVVRPRVIEVEGRTFHSIGEAARQYGLKPKLVDARLRSGWTIEEALGLVRRPRRRKGRTLSIEGRTYPSLKEAARAYNLAPGIVYQRVSTYGWTLEETLGLNPRNRAARGKPIMYKEKMYPNLRSLAVAFDLRPQTLRDRIMRYGYTVEEAIETSRHGSKRKRAA